MSDEKDNALVELLSVFQGEACGFSILAKQKARNDIHNYINTNYILKQTADKQLDKLNQHIDTVVDELCKAHKVEIEQVMGDGAGVYINRQIKEVVEGVLKPIREADLQLEEYNAFLRGERENIRHEVTPPEDLVMTNAIKETLSLADKENNK